MNRTKPRMELEDRTMAFGLATLKMLRDTPAGVEMKNIRRQLTHSAASMGATYRTANLSESRTEYAAGIAATRRNAAESEYWLKIAKELHPDLPGIEGLHRESMELLAHFDRLRRSAEKRRNQG